MNTQAFTYLLEHPEHISGTDTIDIRSLIAEFPYFQSAHALYLKGLKNEESFAYNKALKITAAHTTDRGVLFEYITSDIFDQNEISTQIKAQETYLRDLDIESFEDVSLLVQEEEQEKASKILDPNLFIKKEVSEITKHSPEEILSIGKPLEFDTHEAHSFQEWLQLSKFSPIERENLSQKTHQEETTLSLKNSKKHIEIESNQTPDTQDTSTEVKRRKQDIIDSFIATNPKIEFSPAKTSPKKNLAKASLMPPKTLMTETLARVYIEQKNFKKAKQAYRILSLKYPEKSGFFADQIRAVEQLEENKE